jgi:hypothetical protein
MIEILLRQLPRSRGIGYLRYGKNLKFPPGLNFLRIDLLKSIARSHAV